VHTNYTGNIHIAENKTLEFAAGSTADYQRLSGTSIGKGKLTGAGTLLKTSGWNLYYEGDASQFTGKTEVKTGTFALNTGSNAGDAKYYGAETPTGSFTVHADAVLSSGGGAGIRTGSFVMESGSTLVLNPGKFIIRTNGGGAELAQTGSGVLNLNVLLGAGDVGAGAKLSFQDAGGAILTGAGTAIAVPGTLNLALTSKGYYPAPPTGVNKDQYQSFTLLEGLDFVDDAEAVGSVTQNQLNITTSEKIWNDTKKAWEIEFMRSGFYAYYDKSGKLILEQYSYVQVPEPSTYALSGAALLLGLALFRRTRQRKQAKKA
jgi:hypothetical protein